MRMADNQTEQQKRLRQKSPLPQSFSLFIIYHTTVARSAYPSLISPSACNSSTSNSTGAT